MIIVLEGPDGSGKSTLGESLSEAFGFPLVHSGKPKHEDLVRISRVITALDDTIIDRVPWISEFVYAKVFGRGDPPEELIQVGESVRDRVIVVRCDTDSPDPLIKDNEYKDRSFSLAVKEKSETIRQTYDEVFDAFLRSTDEGYSAHPVIHYDYKKMSPTDVIDLIRKILQG